MAQVHAHELVGEEGGLLAALTCLDLEDDVPVVVRVAGHQGAGEGLLRGLELLDQGRQLGREVRLLGGQLAGGGEILLGGVAAGGRTGHGLERRIAPGRSTEACRVTDHLRPGHLGLEPCVLGQRLAQCLTHRHVLLRT